MNDIILISAGIALAFIIFIFSISLIKKKILNQNVGDNLDEVKSLLNENEKLKKIIANLENQIQNLNRSATELRKINSELESQTSSLQSYKERLEDLQKQKDDFFATVIHDIKNPAAAIQGLVGLLNSYELTASEQQEIIKSLVLTSGRIISLAQEISRAIALESRNFKLKLSKSNLNDVIFIVVEKDRPYAERKSIKLEVDTSRSLGETEFDPTLIEEVIDNLLNNAIKYSTKDCFVKVKSYHDDNNVFVEVIDNGIGLDELDVQKAFGKGAKLSAKPTGDESSSGWGLWIVKKIIDEHKGRVWVKSATGKGSTFAFQIPKSQN